MDGLSTAVIAATTRKKRQHRSSEERLRITYGTPRGVDVGHRCFSTCEANPLVIRMDTSVFQEGYSLRYSGSHAHRKVPTLLRISRLLGQGRRDANKTKDLQRLTPQASFRW